MNSTQMAQLFPHQYTLEKPLVSELLATVSATILCVYYPPIHYNDNKLDLLKFLT